MVPHVFGWFTMSSVWFILCVQLENAKRDIAEVSDRRMPDWVDAVIYGSFLIFMSFAFVQIIWQRLAPGFYWGAHVHTTARAPDFFTGCNPFVRRYRGRVLHPVAHRQDVPWLVLADQRAR